jgi:hypothetical protein
MTDKEFERVLAFLIDGNIVRQLLRPDNYENNISQLSSGRDESHLLKINLIDLLN